MKLINQGVTCQSDIKCLLEKPGGMKDDAIIRVRVLCYLRRFIIT